MSLIKKLVDHLEREHADLDLEDIQATVLRERPEPYYGTHVLLHFETQDAARDFLRRLTPRVRSAADWWDGDVPWIGVGISYEGLVMLGLPQESLESFPESFRLGMAGRAEQLFDVGPNDPENWEDTFKGKDIHAAVTVFAADEEQWRETLRTAEEQFADLEGIVVIGRDDFGAQPDSRNSLGFKDMISNPAIAGSGVKPLPGQGTAIKPGEFVLGYAGESGQPYAMPQPEVLGRNGTYAAMRKYHTNAGSFNDYLRENADDEHGRELLAAKMVGRWRSGAPLELAPQGDDAELGQDPERNNDFDYSDDQDGFVTPLGSHTRRVNPRDTDMEIMSDVNIHRIIRRATLYGPPYDPAGSGAQEDAVERGLYFIFMSAKAMDTMEFLQKEWINKGHFMGLGKERDPIVGIQEEDLTFTVPQKPVRCRFAGMTTFNELRGGEYFFMPSLSALEWMCDPS